MKSCPTCNRTFGDFESFCVEDGSVLSAPFDPDATQHTLIARITDLPPTEILPNATASFPPERKDELFGGAGWVIARLSEGRAFNPLLLKALIALLKGESKVDTSEVKWSKAKAEDLRLNELLQMLERYGTVAVAVLEEDEDYDDKELLIELAEKQLTK